MISKENNFITKTNIIQFLFILLNFSTAIYLSTIFTKTTNLICYNDDAREFLEQIQYIPVNPHFVYISNLVLFSILIILSFSRDFYKERISVTMQTIFIIFDIIICTTIMYLLNMSNKEILLIPIVHIILYIKGRSRRTILISSVVILYTLLDSDFLSIPFNMIPIKEYIEYHNESVRLSMYGIKSILNSSIYIYFIFFIFFDIQFRIDENKKVKSLNKALESSLKSLEIVNMQLEEYSKKSEDLARVKERNRLAREIHDTVGHTLVGIELGLKACRLIPKESPERLLKQIDSISELASKGSKDIRLSLNALKPDALQRYDLIPALTVMTENINKCGNVCCELNIKGPLPRLIAQQEELIYRIVQEGITNAIRHGEATKIIIGIQFVIDNIMIQVSDNGIGCSNIIDGFGLTHLREGVEFYHGVFNKISQKNGGILIDIQLPVIKR